MASKVDNESSCFWCVEWGVGGGHVLSTESLVYKRHMHSVTLWVIFTKNDLSVEMCSASHLVRDLRTYISAPVGLLVTLMVMLGVQVVTF